MRKSPSLLAPRPENSLAVYAKLILSTMLVNIFCGNVAHPRQLGTKTSGRFPVKLPTGEGDFTPQTTTVEILSSRETPEVTPRSEEHCLGEDQGLFHGQAPTGLLMSPRPPATSFWVHRLLLAPHRSYRPSAVHRKTHAGDVIMFGEENGRLGHVLRFPLAAK